MFSYQSSWDNILLITLLLVATHILAECALESMQHLGTQNNIVIIPMISENLDAFALSNFVTSTLTFVHASIVVGGCQTIGSVVCWLLRPYVFICTRWRASIHYIGHRLSGLTLHILSAFYHAITYYACTITTTWLWWPSLYHSMLQPGIYPQSTPT